MAHEYNSSRQAIQKEVIQNPQEQAERPVEHKGRTTLTPDERRKRNIRRIHRFLYFIVHIITIFIVIRFLLVMAGADPQNPFAAFLYSLTAPFLTPFLGLFGDTPPPTYNQNIFEVSDLVAIGIYYLFAWIIARIVVFSYPRPKSSTATH